MHGQAIILASINLGCAASFASSSLMSHFISNRALINNILWSRRTSNTPGYTSISEMPDILCAPNIAQRYSMPNNGSYFRAEKDESFKNLRYGDRFFYHPRAVQLLFGWWIAIHKNFKFIICSLLICQACTSISISGSLTLTETDVERWF